METTAGDGLRGLRVAAFESRREAEMGELIRRHGGEAISAPSLRELPVADNRGALEAVAAIAAGRVDVVVFMTGVGLRALAGAVAEEWPAERLRAALGRAKLVARGPKPAAALRELGLAPDLLVSEPNTWREVLDALDTKLPVAGKRVAVQEYGAEQQAFVEALRARGAVVTTIAVYRWALPEDLRPLRDAIRAICAGSVDVALFTSATQVVHLFRVAADDTGPLRRALGRVALGSIGPVCSAALREHGVEPDFEPEHGKMGRLVGAAAARAKQVLAAKRERGSGDESGRE